MHLDVLRACGFASDELTGGNLTVTTPIDGSVIAEVPIHSAGDAEAAIARAVEAFAVWRTVPAVASIRRMVAFSP